jgi:hypothetical protein
LCFMTLDYNFHDKKMKIFQFDETNI